MSSISSPLMDLSWPLWKENWRDVLATAAVAAVLEAGTLFLFLYMFIQDGNRLFLVVGGSLLIFCLFHVGVFALHAYLISRPTTTRL
jgi:membrane-bound ClpP family serine protease